MIGLTIFQNNFRRNMAKKSGFALTLLLPIVVVILGVTANYISKPSFTLGIINTAPTTVTEQIIRTLRETERVEVENANPSTKKTDMITGRYSAILEFGNDGFQLESVKDQDTLATLFHIVEKYSKEPKPVDIEMLFDTSLGIPERTCAFILLFLMVTATINASLITKDRNNGTIRRIKYSPCSAASYVSGNIFYNFTITYLQYFIAISIITILRLDTGISYGNYLLMGVWIALFTTAFGTCMASLFRKEMLVNLFATCIALIFSLIGGSFISLEKMPHALKQISVISPVRWFIESANIMEQGKSWFCDYTSILVLTGSTVLLFAIAMIRNKHMKTI
ncbi:ABC transporter permease [Paenibacillus sp. CAA11]|uniref:ABC transporter permease n=1 Tax=Paenibacillus sp. CAA11 TaxID=1532905 RepID=UPI000D36C6AE|nr:ABC transporter permease [Paenibacillus sp. CAA11]AWB43568.1 ABC transporter permease [Paenibacillus sp. CAA11]